MAAPPYYQNCLRQELERRVKRNARYSIRAYASSLDISYAYLSRILSGERSPSPKIALKLAEQLGLAARQRQRFVTSVEEQRSRQKLARVGAEVAKAPAPTAALEEDTYEVLGDIHHMALLELTLTDDFRSDARWVAKQLRLTVVEVQLIVARLQRLGLLAVDADGRWMATNANTTTKDKSRTSRALKQYQKQILERATHALLHEPYERRSMASMTLAIDPEKMPLARQMIQEFMDDLADVLGEQKKTQVYQLGVSLYPLQRGAE